MLLMYSGIKFKVSELINIFILNCHLISNISVLFSITKDNQSFCFVVNSLDKWCINQDNRTYLQFLFIQLYFWLTDLPPGLQLNKIKFHYFLSWSAWSNITETQWHNSTFRILRVRRKWIVSYSVIILLDALAVKTRYEDRDLKDVHGGGVWYFLRISIFQSELQLLVRSVIITIVY